MNGYAVKLLDYMLPPELIAQAPLAERTASRMLHLNRRDGSMVHRAFTDLAGLLSRGDLLVVNDTKVIPGRLRGRKLTGGSVELVVLKEMPDRRFKVIAQVRGGMSAGDRYLLANGFQVEVEWSEDGVPQGIVKAISFLPDSHIVDEFSIGDLHPVSEFADAEFLVRFYRGGEMPIPPYIKSKPTVPDRYQTVFARARGSAGAPTAGLHFTNEFLDSLAGLGISVHRVTLHVGIGTFLPVHADDLAKHTMHGEEYFVPEETAAAIRDAKRGGRRVTAVGTTTVRTLETVFAPDNLDEDGLPRALSGESSLFIYPEYKFNTVSAMLTNFHLPRSTLLAMIFAFAGRDMVLKAYQEAIRERYRFYSFGDCMFIE